jgi:hypothetical protein
MEKQKILLDKVPTSVVDVSGNIVNTWKIINIASKIIYREGSKWCVNYYWLAECTNCGKIIEKSLNSAAKYGCRNCHQMFRGQAGLNHLFLHYSADAGYRNLDFILTIEEFKNLTSSSCFYCGVEPFNVHECNKYAKVRISEWGNYLYNGVDRLDSNLGYINNNCVPCCVICNRAKSNMPIKDFILDLQRVVQYQKTIASNFGLEAEVPEEV